MPEHVRKDLNDESLRAAKFLVDVRLDRRIGAQAGDLGKHVGYRQKDPVYLGVLVCASGIVMYTHPLVAGPWTTIWVKGALTDKHQGIRHRRIPQVDDTAAHPTPDVRLSLVQDGVHDSGRLWARLHSLESLSCVTQTIRRCRRKKILLRQTPKLKHIFIAKGDPGSVFCAAENLPTMGRRTMQDLPP